MNKSLLHAYAVNLKVSLYVILGFRSFSVLLIFFLLCQDYKCSYTGDDLVLGGNAWVDHIMPRSRFSELADDVKNVEWVTATVNRMKQNQTPDEFLSLIQQIHDYRFQL